MSNLALYRKYRSRTFDEMVGQDNITNALRSQIVSGRISHAYLFTGTRGTGKTSCAKILSRAVNCLNPHNGNPCNECEACLAALGETTMDIVEMDAASNNGVDNIRQLRDECRYSPASMKKRVYIIDEVHMLSSGAFNALLKTLEEPPEHTIFVLATTEIHKVPITILSRCQRYDFRRIDGKVIFDHIKKIAYKEGFTIEDEAAQLIAKLGDGSMRDAISLLDRCLSENDVITYDNAVRSLSLPQNELIGGIWNAICTEDVSGALTLFNNAYAEGRDIISVFDNILSLIRDIYIIKSVKDVSNITLASSFTVKELNELAKDVTPSLLDYFIDTINNTLSKLTRTSARKMDGEVCLIKLCSRVVASEAPVSVKPATAAVKIEAPKPAAKAPQAVESDDAPPFTDADAPALTDDDAPPFDIPAEQEKPKLNIPHIPKIEVPKSEIKKAAPSPDNFKKDFMAKLGSKVNVAIRQFLNNATILPNGGAVAVVCDKDYIDLLNRPSVTNALNETASEMGFTAATITDKMPKSLKGDDEPKVSTGMDELMEKARKLGLMK
ncbi:MAG: DNA polymerase III subunit gamma/tau [Clostridia bacterium]|nr:DNA polymerase III subunit gamma/tau [Clostridia bacterium]